MTSFTELSLAEPLLRAVADAGYTVPTPIQAQAIPVVMAGRDVMGGAQTGTGKTAGFTLPLLHRLLPHANTSASPARHPVRALILTPTRELAAQVEDSVRTYARHTGLRSTVVFGGVAIEPQMEALRRGVEILVATPGRLLDHVQQRMVNLSQVEVFVLDEADRMLDMGFIPDVKRIIALLPKSRQNLLFSATFPDDVRRLADSLLSNPVKVQVAPKHAVAERVTHRIHPIARERKRELLVHLVRSRDIGQALVFTATRIGCNRLTYQLNREGVHAAAIHGDKSQAERMEALDAFKAGKVGILVATDVAARGLDIEDLPFVINFDLPNTPEDYVHRIGRTGRAGNEGEAISLVSPDEQERLGDIEKHLKRQFDREIVNGFSLSGRDAAGLMDTRRDRGGRDRRSRERDQLTQPAGQSEAARRRSEPERVKRPGADPIFSQPYEPGVDAESADKEGGADRDPRKREPQVAALLGGIVSKRT